MADGVFNIAKGRVVELYNRVKGNDPTTANFTVMLGLGAVTDVVLKDFDDFGAIIADAGFTEATFTNYVRKFLDDTILVALPAPDDATDSYDVDLNDVVWTTAGGVSNDILTRMVIGYDALGTNVNANIIPMVYYDFAVTTDGTNLTAQFDAAGFFRAT